MKRKLNFLAAIIILLLPAACHFIHDRDVIFQTAPFPELAQGHYDGEFSFGELRKHGDFGLGTFNGLDGEMIELNGIFYQVKADGRVYPVDSSMNTPFAMVTYFDPDRKESLSHIASLDALGKYLDGKLGSKDIFYAIKIKGRFAHIKVRSVPAQSEPYRPLSEAIKDQAVFELDNVTGTMVGFRTPESEAEVSVPGYHFHFITSDRRSGGHVLGCQVDDALAEIDYSPDFFMALPASGEFYNQSESGSAE